MVLDVLCWFEKNKFVRFPVSSDYSLLSYCKCNCSTVILIYCWRYYSLIIFSDFKLINHNYAICKYAWQQLPLYVYDFFLQLLLCFFFSLKLRNSETKKQKSIFICFGTLNAVIGIQKVYYYYYFKCHCKRLVSTTSCSRF